MKRNLSILAEATGYVATDFGKIQGTLYLVEYYDSYFITWESDNDEGTLVYEPSEMNSVFDKKDALLFFDKVVESYEGEVKKTS